MKKYLEIKSGDPNSGCMSVPFWRIHDTKSELLNILYAHKDENPIKFNFPLIGDILEYCNCTFTNYGVEIEPYAIPISMITAFNNAKRRIFMSATLCDDSQLVSVFDIDKNIKIISPRLASDIGDRMILFPQAYTPQITDEDLKNKLKEYSSKCNVVVIVPSNYRSEFWKDVTSDIYTAFNIVDGVKKMRSQKNGLYVLVNKYDGIDLPDDACRIIVLDGLPDARTALEKLNEDYLQGSVNSNKEKIQKIEQGMGRGIRSNNDYCGIIIMGAALVHILYSQNAVSYFSMATQKQYEVSSLLAQDLKGKSLDEIFSTLDYCIEQNKDWVELSKKALSDVKYDTELKVEPYLFVLLNPFVQQAVSIAVPVQNFYLVAMTIMKHEHSTAHWVKSEFLFNYGRQTVQAFTHICIRCGDVYFCRNMVQHFKHHPQLFLQSGYSCPWQVSRFGSTNTSVCCVLPCLMAPFPLTLSAFTIFLYHFFFTGHFTALL